MKLAVVIVTYCRENGKSRKYLERMFKNLREQTCQEFKVFIMGDCYSNNEEFLELCKAYESTGSLITYKNLDKHFRTGIKRPENRWKCGGSNARRTGIQLAINEGYDYYLHLDDDDVWLPDHILSYSLTLAKYPSIDFLISVSKYRQIYHSPGGIKSPATLNNYYPRPGSASHSSWCINLNTLGHWLIQKYDRFLNNIETIIENNKNDPNCREPTIMPFDAHILQSLGSLYKTNALTTLCLPTITVEIESDGNHPHQGV